MGAIGGKVLTTQGIPVPNAEIVLKDPSGKVRAQAGTDARGQYSLRKVASGPYQLTLDPVKTGFLGNTFGVCLCPEDVTLNWTVSTTGDAVATPETGINLCGGLFGLGMFGLGALLMGIAASAAASPAARGVTSSSQ
jgi:hypothetical protein